jgi:uncharacterized protein (DUF2062 family)/2-polyprenyl-3-methyl-5-hydroxy-6-metoxy-1,4-benzoquinol methylase
MKEKRKRGRASREVRDILYRMRTEGTSPGKQGAAVALGVFIGLSPLYGLHLALCILLARLLRLNPGLTYLAAHISLPGITPFLLLAELEAGRRLRGQSYLHVHIADLRHLGFRQVGADLLIGSVAIGGVFALVFGLLAWWLARRRQAHPEIEALLEEAACRYLEPGILDWEFVRGKLRHDPLYFNLLRRGFLPPEGRLLDLGCGRGILFSLLLAAHERLAQGKYPEGWAAPPHLSFHGIEGRPKVAEVAREAFDGLAEIETADLRTAALPPADAILLLDVLHYLPPADQESLLEKTAAALRPGGVLLLRDADAGAGWRFTATRMQERLSAMVRRHWRQRFHYRGAAEWRELLERSGLTVEVQPMGMGTPYANVLLAGRRRDSWRSGPGN